MPSNPFRRRCLIALVCAGFPFAAVHPQKNKATAPQIRFENRQKVSGVRFVLENSTTEDKPIIDGTLGGLALLDFDNDGYLDIFFTNGAKIPSLVKENESFHNRLYRNNHDGTFTDVTARARVAGEGYSMGVAAADFDNDGWSDLYITGVNRNILYRNNGDGTFSDVTKHTGVSGVDGSGKKLWSVGAAWLDYDNDGRLDLFVTNYLDWSFANARVCGEPGKRLSCPPALYQGLPNFLYNNNGNGTFTEVSASTGIAPQIGKGMSAAIADYDGDDYVDIFVANDNERNFLFHNQQGRGFVEVGVESAVAYTEDGVPVSSMGADFRDLNNDGRPDVIVTALEGETFPLYLNQGRGIFTPDTYQTGLGFASNRMSGWGVGAYDLNNDGWKDLFVVNSHVSENVGLYGNYRYRQANAVFLNSGKRTFLDVTAQAGAAIRVPAAHRGAAFGDLDNDGKVDVVVSAIGGPAEIWYNTSANSGHWILIETRGKLSNRDGIGTRIKITGASRLEQYNHVTTATGYASSSDKRVHFGLGSDDRIREIELRWPSGKVQVLRDVRADQVLKVTEP